MNTCKTCKWHNDDIDFRVAEHGGGVCTCPKLCEEYRVEDYASDQLVYSYSEGGSFWTGNDFGCVHYRGIKDTSSFDTDEDFELYTEAEEILRNTTEANIQWRIDRAIDTERRRLINLLGLS